MRWKLGHKTSTEDNLTTGLGTKTKKFIRDTNGSYINSDELTTMWIKLKTHEKSLYRFYFYIFRRKQKWKPDSQQRKRYRNKWINK
jgi:hypothetical protein